jgi:predicted ATPase/DNA-binding CsgD family transcriptional regulator
VQFARDPDGVVRILRDLLARALEQKVLHTEPATTRTALRCLVADLVTVDRLEAALRDLPVRAAVRAVLDAAVFCFFCFFVFKVHARSQTEQDCKRGGTKKGPRNLVCDDLDLDPPADNVGTMLDEIDAADVQPHYPPAVSVRGRRRIGGSTHSEPASQPRHNLPAELNSFVGREQELIEVERLLGTSRLLTLVGTGGVGKTRLAQRVAAHTLDRYPDGAWLIELAAVVESALLPYAAAMSLSLRERPGLSQLAILTEHLQPRQLLLVFDNCEHLVASCAELIEALLRGCPGLRVLATSREPLGVTGEIAWRVPSLSLPWPPQVAPCDADLQSEAVRLFLERAGEASPTFAATEHNEGAIARLCYRLDGIPLALELAATRVTALSVEQIAHELDDRFRLLVGGKRTAVPRQQTLQATFDWSFDLLTDPERAVLRRSAPFAGGFGLDAARAVCSGGEVAVDDVLDLLNRLVNKSLVAAEVRSDVSRFHLLETVQQYAAARLQEAGETFTAGAQHLRWFLDLAERAEPEQRSADQTRWLDRLELEHENITAALEWSRTAPGGAEAGLGLAASLRWFWFARGHPSEGLLWLERGIADTSGIAPPVRAKALDSAGALCHSLGDLMPAETYLTEGLAIWRQMGDQRGMAISLNTLGLVAKAQGRLVRAGTLLTKALALAREMNDAPRLATVLNNLAALSIDQGDYGAAQPFLRESLAIKRLLGDAAGIANSLHNLGDAALHQGAYEEAASALREGLSFSRRVGVGHVSAQSLHSLGMVALRCGDFSAADGHLRESLSLFQRLGDRSGIALCLEGLAEESVARGACEPAVVLLSAASTWREANDFPVPPYDRSDYDRVLGAAHSGLKSAAFGVAWAAGAAMSLDQAIDQAPADELERSVAAPRPRTQLTLLTPREREVARLVSLGLTNRSIADELGIAAATATLHVEHIRGKLGFHSRAQIATWVSLLS